MSEFSLSEHPHRRFNQLTREWILVSPHRTKRPWQGQVEKQALEVRPSYDPNCYLCPGNARAGGVRNPSYEQTYVFENDFAALLPEAVSGGMAQGLLRAKPERGDCRVICFTPQHNLSLGEMELLAIGRVVDAWAEQTTVIGSQPHISYVQIFENRGAMMGASNPHPHGQIWSTESIPCEPAKELGSQRAYFAEHGRPLLLDYLAQELDAGDRVVCENDGWVVVTPFWAVWPFETLLLPRRARQHLAGLVAAERDALADILKRLITRYDNLFQAPFPYSMGWHQQPTDGDTHPEWVLHAHFYPPLLRSATVRKFMVGFEMLGEPQRDIPPELAAARLREQAEERAPGTVA